MGECNGQDSVQTDPLVSIISLSLSSFKYEGCSERIYSINSLLRLSPVIMRYQIRASLKDSRTRFDIFHLPRDSLRLLQYPQQVTYPNHINESSQERSGRD